MCIGILVVKSDSICDLEFWWLKMICMCMREYVDLQKSCGCTTSSGIVLLFYGKYKRIFVQGWYCVYVRDERFVEEEQYEWFKDYSHFQHLILENIKPTDKVCNSIGITLQSDLYCSSHKN